MPHIGLGLKEGLLNVSGDSLLLFSFLEERWLRPVMSESALVSSAELMGVVGERSQPAGPVLSPFLHAYSCTLLSLECQDGHVPVQGNKQLRGN